MLFFFTWLFSPRDIFYIVFFFLPYLPFSLCLFSTLFFCLLTWFLASFSFLSHALLFHQMFIWHCVSSGSKAENKTDRNPWLHKTYFNELDSKPTWWAAVYGVAQSRTWLKQLSSSKLKYSRSWRRKWQYPCQRNPMNRGAWWASVHWVTKSQTWRND